MELSAALQSGERRQHQIFLAALEEKKLYIQPVGLGQECGRGEGGVRSRVRGWGGSERGEACARRHRSRR